MKKLLLAILLVGGTAATSLAQSNREIPKFSIGAEAGLPVGDAGDVFSATLGASIKYDLPITTGLFFTVSGGYQRFLYKDEYRDALLALGVDRSGENFIPLKGGLKYYFNDGFFAEGQLGAVFTTGDNSSTAFVYAPGVGYSFTSGIETGIRYEGWSKNGTIGQVALRVAVNF